MYETISQGFPDLLWWMYESDLAKPLNSDEGLWFDYMDGPYFGELPGNDTTAYRYGAFRREKDGDYYYGWFFLSAEWVGDGMTFNILSSAFCTIPNYPLKWGQTSLTGVEENLPSNAFATVHPNPTNGQVTITGENLRQAEVFNTLGQKVLNAKGEGNQLRIDMAKLPAGIYFATVTDEEGRKCVSKVVKE